MKALFAAAALLTAGTVNAGADCAEHPKDEWMDVFALQKMIVNDYGFAIKMFKVDDECYEIYGWEMNDSGEEQKIEVYFDTKTGAIVKKEID